VRVRGEDEVFAAYHIPDCETHMNLRRRSGPDHVKRVPITDIVLQPLPAEVNAMGLLLDPVSTKVGILGTITRITAPGEAVISEIGYKSREFGPCDVNALVHCIYEKPMTTWYT
jgi:hypothetical protein